MPVAWQMGGLLRQGASRQRSSPASPRAAETCIGIQDPGNCIGIHLNMPIALPDPATMNDLTDKEKSAIAAMQHYNDWDSGYSKQQSTRPQNVAAMGRKEVRQGCVLQ